MNKKLIIPIISIIFILSIGITHADEKKEDEETIYEKRMSLFKKTEALTQIPWYYFAAIDNFERNTQSSDDPEKVISIEIPSEMWFGIGNIHKNQSIGIIEMFDGKGKDGNGDGIANPENAEDILYTMGNILLEYGQSEDDIKIALWNYYKRDLTVQTIENTSKVFRKFKHIHLTDRAFPVDIGYNYTYHNTWGDRRGFGGLRIHEGTDIFADYGTPVKSTTYGVVEMMGWNLYGGWRVGIRDIFNIYHYYAHMSGYQEDLKIGQVVKPGDVLGSVGSTGYGPPGTSGKFPPHLHYGMYKDNGKNEFSFDPYSYLKKWERIEKE
ncbi:M23 family metallopeptidase [Oceanobacillus senegalensis]|uniref:M23 family metallopeptidase n=1 Tax=Oceanobacillus senegalensis TaxID=1936063 RepID=UPI001FE93BF0|nr:M23 family metallopeptidase [Oceanobacillus senegalensis]